MDFFHKVDDEDKIILVQKLPEAMVSQLMDEEEVENRIVKEDPLSLSIDKWNRIYSMIIDVNKLKEIPTIYYSTIEPYIGYKTCALCITSIAKFKELYGPLQSRESKCSLCPLKVVDCCLDEGSSYNKIEKLLEESTTDYPFDFEYQNSIGRIKREFLLAIEGMISSLKSLL